MRIENSNRRGMIPIDSVMARDIITAVQTDTVMTLVEILVHHHIGAVIIVDDKRGVPVGVVTERDIVYALRKYKDGTLGKRAEDIMSSPLVVLSGEESIVKAAEMMQSKRIRRIPIVKGEALIGIVTYKDISAALNKSNALLEIQNEALQEKANRDALTGLYNKGYIMEQLEYHMAFARRSSDTMTLMIIDIDHFKNINDTYGHLCGDEILRQIAAILGKRSRAVNIVGRYGGEEFVIIGPIGNYKSTKYMADRMRRIVEHNTFVWEEHEIKLTISIGVCIWNRSLKTKEEMIRVADEALYKAKSNGRNQVVMGETNENRRSSIISMTTE